MPVGTYSLITLEYAKALMQLDDTELAQEPGLTIYCDATDASAATVQVTDTTLVGVITGGTSAGTTTKTFANTTDDTLGELATTMTAVTGWVAHAVGPDSQPSGDLIEKAATGCLLVANQQTLKYVQNWPLEQLIDAVSRRIEDWCGRYFKSRSYVQLLDGNGDQWLQLRASPISAVTRVAVGRLDAVRIECTATDATNAFVRVTPTTEVDGDAPDASAATVVLTITGGASAGTNTLDLTAAANDTLTELVAVITALSGWSATLLYDRNDAGSRISSDLCVVEGAQCRTPTTAVLEIPDDALTEYHVDRKRGWLYRSGGWPEGNANIRVDYTAGYSTVPASLQIICAELCKEAWDQMGRSAGVESERIGDYQYKLSSFVNGDQFTKSMARKLQNYIRSFV